MANSVAPSLGTAYVSIPGMSNSHNNGMTFCVRCGHGGCDVRMKDCNCSFHAVRIDFSSKHDDVFQI